MGRWGFVDFENEGFIFTLECEGFIVSLKKGPLTVSIIIDYLKKKLCYVRKLKHPLLLQQRDFFEFDLKVSRRIYISSLAALFAS